MVNAGGMGDALRFIPRFSHFVSPRFILSQSLGNIAAVDKDVADFSSSSSLNLFFKTTNGLLCYTEKLFAGPLVW